MLHVVVGLTVKAHVVVVLLQQKDANTSKQRTALVREIVMVDLWYVRMILYDSRKICQWIYGMRIFLRYGSI